MHPDVGLYLFWSFDRGWWYSLQIGKTHSWCELRGSNPWSKIPAVPPRLFEVALKRIEGR
jgi:hypothetical protein